VIPVAPGTIVAGKYRVERLLGRGGMGFVVEATHAELMDRVAIKFLLPELANAGEIVSRFVTEARSARRISRWRCRQATA
jgi:serine/threonine-protein kinase